MISDGDKNTWIVLGITSLLVAIYSLRFDIATGRTIIMDEEGCSVSWGKYRREYKWNDFQVKAVVDFRPSLLDRYIYNRSAIFSTKPKIYNSLWWSPIDYSWMLHPLTFVFINFTPNMPLNKRWIESELYEINEAM